uniref:Dystonin n=1 Tax=Pygocentrus nattereri TaxID=42514 RepID=A0AAR2JH65_PYGNA
MSKLCPVVSLSLPSRSCCGNPANVRPVVFADERDRVQKKTFTKWINQHLLKVRKHVNDLYEDLRDGHNLISLLEVLSGDTLRDFLKTLRLVSAAEACAVERHGRPREKGRMRFHRLQNVQIALDYLKRRQVKLVNIRNDDITDGNPKLTLGLIWTIILHFQISDIHVTGESEDMTAKERLLLWSQQMTEGYVGVRCDNFTTSWRDGRLFNALIHKYRPDLVDMSKVSAQSTRSNLEHAFCVAEQLGVARLLDPEDVDVSSPDEKSVITYVSTLYDVFPKVPEGVEGINANDVDIKWVEYQNMVNYLSQWIKHNVSVMSDRNFPSNPVELKALYSQYLHFKESEIPLKENEKTKIKHLYKMLEVWIEFGRIQLPQGYHPNDVEKEWGKLIVAMLEREKSLRPEVDRLEMLQQIANRVHRDCVAGEDKLALARASLQSDAKRLESGIQFQNEAEVAGYLLECENLLRQQVVDIQILLDGKFYLADQLVQRVSKLRDDLLALRTECSSVYSKGRTLTSDLTPVLTPAMTPALTPGLQPTLVGGGNVETGVLQHLKQMQIRKPMLKSSLVDPNLSEEEVNMKFVQDLLNWVEEMQVQLDRGEWGSDLPSVESHLENHRNVHKAIEDFQMSLKEAKISEVGMTQPLKQSYSEKLGNLENQYGRLLNCSRERQKHLDSLHDFVSHATEELIWLNEKEEEEVAFDWSERNSNVSRKKDYHAELMRELDKKEGMIKSVQDQADSLLQQNHPARLTIEAYKAAMQTQWSWILQLCYCVEQHLKENTVYFEFFNDAKESMDYLKSLQDSISRKYSCDRTSGLHRLEDLIQESMDEKEQLLQYRSTVAGLVGRAKSIVQLKPRNPEYPIRTSIPVKAICDYRQIEITIYKEDECVLASNSHRAKWKVISPSGNEAMVPSVCFSVPAPNKEAVDMASRIEQLYQNVLALWHRSHINMKSVVSWHYLMMDIRTIRKSTTMLPGEHQQVLSSLQSHFEEFLEDSEESEVFTVADCAQLEREVLASKEYYEELLKSAEREEHEESVYNLFISEVRNFRMRVEAHEEQLIRHIRTPLDRDDLQASMQRINEQEVMAELDRLKEDLEVLKEKCEVFLRQAANSPSVPTLSSELSVLTQSMAQVYSMCSIYLEKSEIDDRREVFHDLEDELQKARVISDRMFKTHNERDFDLDWHKEKAEQLGERWRNVHSQIENRSVSGATFSVLCLFTHFMKKCVLLQVLVAEIERKQSKIDECQKYSEQYSAGVKDYELQLMTYRAMVDSQHKSPVKRRRMQSSSDAIQQEFMDLRTRYTALVTLMTQYVKFASETLKRAEEDEVGRVTIKVVDSPIAGLWVVALKKRLSILKGLQQNLVDRLTALKFLEAQACTGGICDPASGERVQIAEALRRGLLDESFARQLQQYEQAYYGVIHPQTGKTLTNGLIDQSTGLSLLEAQLITSELILPEFRMCLDLEDAFKHNLVDGPMYEQLQDLNGANRSIQEASYASEPLPVVAAVNEGAISERLAIKIIEIQLATGGLRVTYTGECLSLERAFQFGLIPHSFYVKILERQNSWKDLIDPNTAEKVSLIQLMQRSIVHEETGLRLLPVKSGKDGTISLTSGREISILRAVHEGLIDRETMIRLLSAQLFAGGIVDPKTNRKLTVEEALSEGLIDQDTASGILSHQSKNGGIVNPHNGARLTVDEAVQCDLMSSRSALLVLERQKCFMGLLWPHSGEILTVSTSVQHEIITDKLASELLCHRHKIAALYIPENSEVVDIDSATRNGLIDTYTKELLKTLEIPDTFPDVDNLNDRFSTWLVMREVQLEGSQSTSDEMEVGERSISAHSSSEFKQLFISYLMMNSYMDPKSGQRLLIFDGQLNKMAKLLLEVSDSGMNDPSQVVMHDSPVDENFSENALELHATCSKDLGIWHIEKPLTKISEETDSEISVDDIPQDEFHITHASKLEIVNIEQPLARIPEDSGSEMCIEGGDGNEDCMRSLTSGSDRLTSISEEIFNSSSEKGSHKSLVDEIKMCQSVSIETILPDSSIKNHTNDAVSVFTQPLIGMQISHSNLHDSFLHEVAPQDVNEVCITHTNDLANMHIEQPVTRIPPESGLEISTEEQLNHAENTGQAEEPADCSILSTEVDKSAEMTSEHPQCEVTWNDKLERAHAVHLLRGQVEEGGILDVTSGKKYDLNAAVDKGLIDEQTVLEVLALQLQKDDVVENPAIAISVLKQAVLQGSISPQVALQIMEQQNLLGGFYDPTSGKTISVTEAWEMGLITDYLCNVVLHSEPVRKAIIDPEGNRIRNVSDAHHLGMLDDEKAENMQQERDQKLDLHGEQFSEERPSAENDVKKLEEPTCVPIDRTQMVSNLSSSLKTVSNTPFKTFAPAGIDPGKETVIDHIVHTQDSQDCQNLDLEADRNSMLFGNVTQKEAEKGGVSYIALHKVPLDRDSEAAVNLMVSPVQSNSGMSCSSESDICSGERFSLLNLSQFSESQQMARTSTSDIYSTQLKTLLSGNEDVNTIKDHQPYLSSCATSSQLAEQRASGKKSQDEQHLDLNVLPHSQNGQTNPSQCPITENSMSAKEPEHESKSDEAKSSEVLKQFQSSHVEIVDHKEHRKDSTTNVETSKLMDISQVFSRDITPVMPPLTLLPDVTLSNTEIGDTSNLQQFVEHPTQSYFQAPDEAEPAAIESKMPKLDSSSAITNRYETTVSQNVSDKIVESASDPAYDMGVQRSKSAELQPDSVLPNSSDKTRLYFNTSQNTDGVEPCSGDAKPSKAQDLRKVPPKSDDRSYFSEAASENEIQRTQTEDLEKNLSGTRQHLEDTAFDVQYFISEHAQFLSPAQNRQLLKSLSATQRAFKELMDRVFTQRHTLDLHLEIREDESLQQQKEFVAKLQEMCDDLTQTENRLIGHQQQAVLAKMFPLADQALQKDIQANASALNEVISSTKKFLEENRSKLTPEQITAIEVQLEEAKSKANMLNQRAEESRKDLEKVMTTAIKQETEKVAAVEQLEESKNKIEGLLDWISNIGKEKEMEGMQKDQVSKQNGNMAVDTQGKRLIGHNDDPNGNELDSTDNSPEWSGESEDSRELDLNQQYEKVKSHHQEILSQQQDLIIATQSAQALLDKQAGVLSPAEKEKLQRDIQELRSRYEASLTRAEQQIKQLQSIQEELRKFQGDSAEFESWLQHAQEQVEELGAPAGQLEVLQEKLQKQKSFYEDVISHKGDLRFITISGQKVLDVAKTCSQGESGDKEALPEVDTSGTCATVKEKLDSATARYKALHTQVCVELPLTLQCSSFPNYSQPAKKCLEARRQLSEPIAADPQTLQRHENTLTIYCWSTFSHGIMLVSTFNLPAHCLFPDDIVERYDNLSKSVSDRNEKLQVTLTRSLSVQDGLDEMMNWMEKVEESLEKEAHVPLDSDTIADALSKEALEQDISSRQSSISTMKAKVKKFAETAEPAAAALLQTKMEGLSQRFTDACEKHKKKVSQMEELKEKVEQFEKTSEKVQQFVLKRSQALCETDGPGKNVNELSQLVQVFLKIFTEKNILSQRHVYVLFALLGTDVYSELWIVEVKMVTGQSGFWLPAELMLVQQNMSCVSEGYRNLGDLLKGRSSELNALLQKVRGAHDEAESMLQWLEDMKKTAASWSSEPTVKDSVKTQMEQQKVDKVLFCRLCFVMMVEVVGSVENRKQHLEESSRVLELFQTTQTQLSQWLQEKELMMSVLGPLSMDPNMLNTQKQQVQILLKEFEGRKPQYEQLNEAAVAITSTSGKQDPAVEKVKEKVVAITQKWQGLTGQLSQRDALIEQAVGKTTQYQELLRRLGESAAVLESQLSGQQALSTQPDAVKKQLEDTNAILSQLCEEKKRLKEAERLCSELSNLVTEEYLKANLTKQLESVSKPFKLLEDKAGKRIRQLNSAFASSQQFHQMSKNFKDWLDQKLQEQAEPQSISAKVETLSENLKEHSAVQRALSEHEESYSTIMKEGEALLQSTEGAEKVALQGQLSVLKSNWEEVKRSAAEREEKLNTVMERAQKYKEHAENLSSWLKECDERQNKVKFSVNPVEVDNSLSQVKAIQKDVDKHRGQMELLSTASDSLLEVATEDVDAVKEEKAVIGKNLDKLAEDLQLKKESLDKLSQRLREFSDTHKELKSQLEGSKKQLESHSSLGVQAYSNKNLTNMKAQQTSLEAVQTQVDHLKSVAQSLVVDVPDTEGVTDLLLQADSLEKEHSSISKAVEDACSTLEDKLQGIGQFQNTIREMFTSFADFDDELDSMAPVGRDLETLRHQQGAIQSFISKLQDLMTNTASARDKCKKMLESEASPDLLGLKRDLEALSKQSGKLMDRANGRKEQVEDTLKHLEEFYSKLQTFTQKMTGAEEQEESQGPVGMETDVINQQLETFKVFQKEAIESLQTQLQDLNWLGQGLIQNAPKGTSTKSLEHDLEEVNTRWNTLNKKVAERSAQLHEALLHCGRFQDALESLLSWLTDTEELVASQKPPSAEFKVVKAQIQEQRLLQRLLDDRRPTVELIKKEGGKVTELADTADKEKIGREIECLGQRWDTLLKKAENRRKQLESILVVAQQFHETLEPLVEWLTATEKCLASSEPIGTQTSKLEEQIRQHKALEEEIIGRSKSLYQAMSLGQVLRTVSCMDDKELVQAKLDSTQSNYIELQERCRRKAELLQQALANAQLFGEDEVALMNWLDEVHCRLSDVSVQDYAPDVLDKQHAEQLALHEDIELRRQNVDQAMQNGLELLKQTTGDEVVVIQGKLDGIKTRYAEISTMSNSVLTTLNKALSLATKMQHTHEELSCWLEKVESELATFRAQESVGEQLTHVQERQKALMKEVQEHKPVVDTLNEVSSALLELVPWRAREGLDKLVTEDNERYRSASDAIAQHVDQTGAAILKSQQFEQAADTELAWLTEAERKLSSLGDIKLEPEQTTAQLQAQKGFSMDIMRHKDAVDDIVKTGEVQSLLEKYNAVSQLNSERCLQLERAHSLACQFWETYEELWPWLQETQASFTQLPQPAIEYETLRQQQEELRQLRELIAEHKPHIDKMNKTGPQLVELSPVEGEPIRETYQATDKLYTQLKADVKHRAAALDEAISKSTQFHDKIDPMLESLERIAERLRQPPSISVEVEKIREQIAENKAVNMDLEKLQPSYETLKQRGEEMITRSEGADKDLSAKAVQDKLDQMVFVWNDIQALLEEREAKLLDVMDLAEKFWCDHCALIVTIKDTQDLLKELEEPGVDPSVVKQQQESVEGYREEIDGLQEELNVVQNLGAELMTACGEPDKPVIKKSLDEVNMAWETLNKTWKERVEQLEEAMQAAVQFQDGLQGMFDWVDILESKLDSMSPVGTDLETVKQQIEELKEFKGEAYQLQIEMERLNHQAGLLLKKVLEEADRITIQEPINELKMLWDNLDEKVINRQHKLEGALLALGQFQHALDELLAWLTHTEDLLSEQKKTSGDPKAIEIELAKHHVLQNDVLAHKSTVEAVNKAGSDLMESSEGEEACGLQTKLENLNQRWRGILEKTEQRRQLLDSALLQAQGFHGEIEDMQQWLKDTERQLLASKAVGGLPDTAREQLNAHLELCSAMEAKEELYQQLLQRGQQLIALTPEGQDSTTEQDLHNLQEKWECVQAKVAERKGKLEEALAMATDFHNSLQDFINWLTQAEQTLTMVSPASLILETILFQIDEHKVFVTEVNSHRDQIIELDKTGTHLKYFSQKQDVVLIKNLLLSVQSRWEKVVQRSVERGRLLDDARKRAKQFHESWTKLMEWLEESERALDSELEIANDPDKIKMQLAQHKEFQKALGGKHSVYDTTSRTGRALKDKTSLQDDNQKLDDMLCELRDKWDTVCGKSVERQNKLEEALLFSGQFTDALQALIDWLYKVEPQLAEDQPVHGDIDLVLNLIDSHKVFQKELGKRTGSVQALKRSARELIENSHDDSSWVKVQMQELSTRWETVCALSVSKQTRLEQALCQAEEFHSTVHILLEWLAEAEQSLRFHGSLPDDEEALRSLIEQHKEFMRKLEEKRVALGKATSMGEAILAICHPDSITTVKHWNTIIKARFEEVTAWARQHQQRLATALSELLATQELLESLLSWLQWAETTLTENDKEVLPQEIEEVKALIAEHQIFMEEMTRKQPDVDKVTKTHKRKATADPPVQSQIPVLDKGRTGRKRSPTQSVYPTAAQAQIETKNPRVNLLVSKWQQVWLLALDRRRKLNDALDRLEELKEFANFDFDVWRKRYMRWMNHKKSRVMDFFRRIDKDQDGKVTRQEFIEGILSSKFPTSRLEMSAVADIFDRDGDGYIDYYEFVAALHPNKDAYKPLTDADKIEDEVTRQVAKCKCPKRFQVEQIGANKYRHNEFINSQQLRLVRILRSTVMVRVGGGWMALDEFLVKNDPCRVHHHGSKMLRSESNSSITQSPIAKGRTNVELREKFILPEGTTQVMASFRYRGRRSRPSSRGASPNRSNSSHSCPAQPNPAAPGASKTPHLTRNYDKPWLTNSKSATPLKSSDSFESQGSDAIWCYSADLTTVSNSLSVSCCLPEVNTVEKSRLGPSKNPSRPGSKAGSRGSSRRGSDASDFDISDIQSVCSDMSETVTDSGRPTPRSASRQRGGKPSKIPTPQRRSTPTSKLAKTTKR